MPRIYLSPPHLNGLEFAAVERALRSNWIAPVGPDLDEFERAFARLIGVEHALGVNSGTAALHLALLGAGIGPGDDVLVSTLTVAGSVNPILHVGARPVFVDSAPSTWTMDPDLAIRAIAERAAAGRTPKALVLVHIYGQCADIAPIQAACDSHGVILIEDAAEALGATYRGRPAGSFGHAAIFSFNGNKIITASGGGMLVSKDGDLVARARKLANQAREPVRHYEHHAVGYNYQMSNVLAALGLAQLADLPARLDARRQVFARYAAHLANRAGLAFMPEAGYGRSTRWLTTLTIAAGEFGASRDAVMRALDANDVESRPVWKPMHQQPVFAACDRIGGAVSDALYANGICLPSGTALTRDDVERIAGIILRAGATAGETRSTP